MRAEKRAGESNDDDNDNSNSEDDASSSSAARSTDIMDATGAGTSVTSRLLHSAPGTRGGPLTASRKTPNPLQRLRRLENRRDAVVSIVFFVACSALLLIYNQRLPAAAALGIAFLGLPVTLLWAVFAALLLLAIVNVLLSILAVVPLQYFPDDAHFESKRYPLRLVVTALTMTIFLSAYYRLHDLHIGLAILVWTISFAIFLLAAFLGRKARLFIGKKVLEMLILPSTKISSESLVTSSGRKIKVMEALRRCRLRFFHNHNGTAAHTSRTSDTRDSNSNSGSGSGNSNIGGVVPGGVPGGVDVEASMGDGQSVGVSDTWCNVTVVGHGGNVRIDAAYYRVPAQAQSPEAEQRWVMWLLGNGEVYEFLLQELRAVALESGLNVFVFNYRGVASSKGHVTCAGDLVSDTVMCLEYMEDTLAAAPGNVLIMGHSIGGAVGTVARACHSPAAPVVVERSFSSLPDAAWALLNMIVGSTLDTTITLPHILVSGLLASIFKGRLDVVEALDMITGEKLVVYHTDDKILPYDKSSAHSGLKRAKKIVGVDEVELSNVQSADHHNLPLHSFPEYERVLRWCRAALRLPPDLPPLPSHVRASLRSQHTGMF